MTAVDPSLAGREPELAALDAAFDRVVDGSPASALISGEAGIGKTRLVREFTERVADRAQVLSGGCIERGSEGLPYAPFTAALRGLAGSLGATGIAELLPADDVGELPRVLPGLGRPDPGTDDETARARLFEQILMLLAGLAAQRPMILVIEDAHWAAASTRDLLDFLVRNQQAAPGLMIVVTYRSDALGRGHPLRAMVAELGRVEWVTHHDLPRLARHEVAQQVAAILGDEPAPELVRDVYGRSQGNPLFVEALVAEGVTSDVALSASLRDLLLAPVNRLPAQAREVLRVAAVGGTRVGHAVLALAAGLDDTSLSEALREVVSGNTLVADGDTYVFRHALLREAVYDDQLPGDRVRTHLHYAEAIADDPALVPDGRAAIELAHHWFYAGELNKAFNAAWHAARDAGASLAFSEQLHMLTRVLELWPKVTSAEQLGTDRLSVLEHAVEAARLAGEAEQGLRLTTSALDEVDEPARTARLLELRSGFRRALAVDGDLDDLREAVRIAPAHDPTRASVLAALAARLLDIPHHEEAQQVAGVALELATTLGDTRTRAHALMLTAIVGARFDRFTEQRPHLHEAQQLAESIGADDLLMQALHAEAHLLENYGEHAQAVEIGRRGMAAAGDSGLARSLVGPHAVSVAGSLISQGRWDEALDVTGQALELAPPPIVRAELMLHRGTIALARGDTELPRNARRLMHDMTGPGANLILPSARLEIGMLLLDDQATAAVAAAKRTMAEHDVSRSSRYAWPFLVLAAQAAVTAADDDQAHELIAELGALADELPIAGPVQRAHRLTFAATIARANGRPGPEEVDAWASAVSAWERLGQPYRHAQALLGVAEATVAAGDRDSAVPYVIQASTLADTLAAVPLRTAAEELAKRARLPITGSGARQADPAEQVRAKLGLTIRELEVLRQVAAGRDNHEIAAHLFISPKTVSVHVSHILDKLGLTNRTQAAAAAHRLGLV